MSDGPNRCSSGSPNGLTRPIQTNSDNRLAHNCAKIQEVAV